MAKERYVVTKTGTDYRVEPASDAQRLTQWGFFVGGGMLTLCGLRSRSLMGALAALAGGALLYRGITGRNPVGDLVAELSATQEAQLDEVDEASMESFPASDPPAMSTTT